MKTPLRSALGPGQFLVILAAILLAGFMNGALYGQEKQPDRVLGLVSKIDAGARQITLKTDAGAEVSVGLDAKASFRRVAPGETNLANAASIALTDISAGDRVLARGKPGESGLIATLVVVMSQADIASKQAAERADWDRRGATGIVTETGGDQVTISVRNLTGVTPLVIKPVANAIVRRYTPESVKFADAKPSKLEEIKKGDQVRARGNKTADGMTMTADEIVSGQFRMIAGVIQSVDAKENLIRINNLETKKTLVVKITGDTSVKKLPPPVSQLIANRLHGVKEEAPAGGPPGAGGPGAGAPGGGRGGFGGGRGGFGGAPGGAGRGPGDLQSMIERIPAIAIGDLMMGDAIILSSIAPSAATPDQATAITVLAGVEPILTKPGTKEMSLGSWNGGGDLGGVGGFGQ
jgi:hypothetical protein